VGTISDLLVDAAGTKATFAIVSANGVSAEGARFTVPLKMLRPVPGRKVVLSANRQDFEHARAFKEGANSAEGDANEIYRYER
jgi:hypothetical protein